MTIKKERHAALLHTTKTTVAQNTQHSAVCIDQDVVRKRTSSQEKKERGGFGYEPPANSSDEKNRCDSSA